MKRVPYGYSAINLPKSIDWRDKGAVSPVRNQGQGETCWAFSSAGAVEGARVASGGQKLVPLSPQELIDCMSIDCSDSDGTMDNAFLWIAEKRNGLLASWQSYPYVDSDCIFWNPPHKCSNGTAVSGAPVLSMHHTIPNNITDLMLALQRGPVSVAVDSSLTSFTTYKGGIYSDKGCVGVTAKQLD